MERAVWGKVQWQVSERPFILQAPIAHECRSVNLAFALALRQRAGEGRLRVGLLDLDIFGPSIPKLMGLESAEEPRLTEGTALHPPPAIASHRDL